MSFRARLSLLFVVAMTALVVATSIATYLVVRSNLQASARRSALALAKSVASIEDPDEGSLDRMAGPGARIWLTNGSGRVIAQSYTTSGGDSSAVEIDDSIAGARRIDLGAMAAAGRGQCVVLLANSAIDSSLSTLFSTLIVVGVAMIAASAVVGALLARRALRPVERMRRQADAIPGDALDRRLTEGSPMSWAGSPLRSTACSRASSARPRSSEGSSPTPRTNCGHRSPPSTATRVSSRGPPSAEISIRCTSRRPSSRQRASA